MNIANNTPQGLTELSKQIHEANALSQSDEPLPIQSVLRILASQEGCDGAPWDQMIQAADYIDELRKDLKNALHWIDDGVDQEGRDLIVNPLRAKHFTKEPMLAEKSPINELKSQPHEIICTKCGLREQRGEKPSADF